MHNLRHCRDGHRQILNISGRLAAVLAREIPPQASVLYALRQELASVLIRHLKEEDWLVYPKLLRSSDPSVVQIAQLFMSEMGGLALAFRDHSERWGAFAIDSDWAGYRREAAQFLEALNNRITREDRDLYPLCDVSVAPVEPSEFQLAS